MKQKTVVTFILLFVVFFAIIPPILNAYSRWKAKRGPLGPEDLRKVNLGE